MIKEYGRATGWTMVDIQGISFTSYIHKTIVEEGQKLSVEHQHNLNPIIKEVVKKK